MNSFSAIKNRMPHFFYNVDVIEYVPHSMSKKIIGMFDDSRYFVFDPTRTNSFPQRTFNVSMSIDYFQHADDYLKQFIDLHKMSSKFVMFRCAAAGKKNTGQKRNLTMADFYLNLDLSSMFESYNFDVDYDNSDLYFWGVKRSAEANEV